MKILVFSDTHGEIGLIDEALNKHIDEIEGAIFLGDILEDCNKLEKMYPDLSFIKVPGNCDFGRSRLPIEMVAEFGGIEILLTHGHRHAVKHSYDKIAAAARDAGVNGCFFGHTHVAVAFEKFGITFLNPGSISQPRGSIGKSYALVEISNGTIIPKIIEITDF